ncbi:MAG TPA: twin-arginine translocase subunit TatC [Pseudomonadales bacterium]|nr:twin-arginine translocase subunit TatC [Pseudomonadales bacterium]
MTQQPEDELPTFTLLEHLIELRDRLLRCILAVLVCFLGLYYFANDMYNLLSTPIRKALPHGSTMIATDFTATFFAPFKLTFYAAIFAAMPYILHQVWRFISPGLYANEKRISIPLLASSVLLFYAGVAFAYFLVFPAMMTFFASIQLNDVVVSPDITHYMGVALKLFLAFGVTFEIPIAVVLAVWSGITDPKALKEMRPYVIVGCFVIAMLVTPPDVISQTMLAVPMWFLFEVGLWFGQFVRKRETTSESTELTISQSNTDDAS